MAECDMLVSFEAFYYEGASEPTYKALFTSEGARLLVDMAFERRAAVIDGTAPIGGEGYLLDPGVIPDTPQEGVAVEIGGTDSFWQWTEQSLAKYRVDTARIPRVKTTDTETMAQAAGILRFLRHERIRRGPLAAELGKQLRGRRLAAQADVLAADLQKFEDGGMGDRTA